jgi:hypothetical protein
LSFPGIENSGEMRKLCSCEPLKIQRPGSFQRTTGKIWIIPNGNAITIWCGSPKYWRKELYGVLRKSMPAMFQGLRIAKGMSEWGELNIQKGEFCVKENLAHVKPI